MIEKAFESIVEFITKTYSIETFLCLFDVSFIYNFKHNIKFLD